jgi:hypothetical protein
MYENFSRAFQIEFSDGDDDDEDDDEDEDGLSRWKFIESENEIISRVMIWITNISETVKSKLEFNFNPLHMY